MGILDAGLLLPPDFPQADNPGRVIDAASVPIIFAVVKAWMNPHKGDKIIVSFNDSIHFPYIVEDPSSSTFTIPCYTFMIPDGQYTPSYTVTESIGQYTLSDTAQAFTVINSAVISYPPLQFVDAVMMDNTSTLTYASIVENRGARAFVTYWDIKKGDEVDICWTGTDTEGMDVPQAAQTIHYTVGDDDINAGGILVTFDAPNVIAVGNSGKGKGQYVVKKDNETSAPSYVRLSWSDVDQLQITSTWFAPLRQDSIKINPYNQATVFGRPGLAVTASVDKVAVIVESENSDDPTVYHFKLDGQGTGTFRVAYPATDQYQGGSVLISASTKSADAEKPDPKALTQAPFSNYMVGPGDIKAYRYTTNAVADGKTACMVYLVVNLKTTATAIQVSIRELDSSATILGGITSPDGKKSTISWNPEDGSATFRVKDPKPEIVTLNIDLPGAQQQSSIDNPYVTLNFINFPDFHIG